jgi:GH24 family phage-related lysozyme (muramidase)
MRISIINIAKNFKAKPNQLRALALLDQLLVDSPLLSEDGAVAKLWRTPEPVVITPKSNNNIPAQAINLIKEFEGFSSVVYDDGVGIPTIGYGTTVYPNGNEVRFGNPQISEIIAKEYLENDTREYWETLSQTIPYWKEMNDNQRSALLSFAYNLGAYFYNTSGFGTITRVLREKDWSSVPLALLMYVNPGTPVEAGLRRRRTEEGKLWDKD